MVGGLDICAMLQQLLDHLLPASDEQRMVWGWRWLDNAMGSMNCLPSTSLSSSEVLQKTNGTFLSPSLRTKGTEEAEEVQYIYPFDGSHGFRRVSKKGSLEPLE